MSAHDLSYIEEVLAVLKATLTFVTAIIIVGVWEGVWRRINVDVRIFWRIGLLVSILYDFGFKWGRGDRSG